MKKILLVFMLSTISLVTFSQSKLRPTYDSLLRPYSLEPFEILAYNFNYSFTFEGSKSLVAKDSKLSKGFEISVHMVQDTVRSKNGYFLSPFFKGLRFRMAGIGRNCVEQGSTLVLELEDGEKLSYSYLEEFICYREDDGLGDIFPTIYFDISQEVWEKLFNTRVKSMTFTEKRTGDSFSYKLKKEEQEFFMEVKEATTRVRLVY